MKKWNNLCFTDKVLIIALVFLTFFRILIAMKIPLFLQADAYYDDYLYVLYSKSLMRFQWLGNFSELTLAKGCSFSFFLLFNYIFGIPYSFALIVTYIFSIVIFLKSVKRIINNKYFLFFTYIYLLFSPVMLHSENIQKVYRGGLLISFSLLVISGVIGIYTRINDKKNTNLFKYVMLTSLSLSYFWFLKEDSIWILPFVLGGLLFTIIEIIKNKENKKRIVYTIIPLVFLLFSITVYKSINYIKYGEYSITDRNGTYFKEVISDLLQIEDKNSSKDHWITKNMMNKAYEVSPTLSKIKKEMDLEYKSEWIDEDEEIVGDIIYWVIKDAAYKSGIYNNGGKEVNNYYKKVHNELTNAFESKKLKRNNEIYISKVVKGITKDEIPEYLKLMKESKKVLLTHSEYDLGLYPSTGKTDNIALFNELTMSQIVLPGSNEIIYNPSTKIISLCNKIVTLYKKTGLVLYYTFIISFVIQCFDMLWALLKKKENENKKLLLIELGLFVTCFAQFFGTTFFCRFLSFRKIYDYSSIMFPLIQILEMMGVYYIVFKIKKTVKKKYL